MGCRSFRFFAAGIWANLDLNSQLDDTSFGLADRLVVRDIVTCLVRSAWKASQLQQGHMFRTIKLYCSMPFFFKHRKVGQTFSRLSFAVMFDEIVHQVTEGVLTHLYCKTYCWSWRHSSLAIVGHITCSVRWCMNGSTHRAAVLQFS